MDDRVKHYIGTLYGCDIFAFIDKDMAGSDMGSQLRQLINKYFEEMDRKAKEYDKMHQLEKDLSTLHK